MRLAVLISGSGSNLQTILEGCADGSIPGEVVAVISNKAGVLGLERAQQAGVPAHVLDHRAFDSREAFDQALMALIDSSGAELVVLAGFMRILSAGFVRHYLGRLLNIHPSLLPKYPGLHTHQRAIEAGDEEAGASVHFVTEELDGGPLIIQARVPVLSDDTADVLAKRVLEQEHRIYPLAVRWYCEGRLKLVPHGVEFDGKALPACGHDFRG